MLTIAILSSGIQGDFFFSFPFSNFSSVNVCSLYHKNKVIKIKRHKELLLRNVTLKDGSTERKCQAVESFIN